ncbi:MAG: T9SS type A sorting domain-containing protein [Ignavibacteria bacterium]|nr:T9SS type A sorting domain-containing protein [Ignavibacteria bacterium]
MKKIYTAVIIILINTFVIFSQPFSVEIEQVLMPDAPKLHSFAFAQAGGKWFFIGGRFNGLHGFTFGFSFQPKYQNRYAWVVDPATGQTWSVNIYSSLSIAKADPLRSMNTQYYQEGDKLYITGGYGLDSLKDSLVTFPTLSVIDVSSVIQAVINNTSLNPHIRQVTDERFRVCGAGMEKLGEYTYIPGGHNFWGEYTRTVNNQIYTNSLKKFKISDNGVNTTISDYSEVSDTNAFHRRDYNLVHSIKQDGSHGMTLYGGVFKTYIDLPYLEPVYIDQSGYTIDNSFQQKMTQYTSSNFLMFDSTTGKMHTTFLGGTSLYYHDEGTNTLVADSLVPFIRDISTLTRSSDGSSSEYIHSLKLPSLIGTNTIFIMNSDVPKYSNGVIKMASLSGRTFIGYMFGGIRALFPNNGQTYPNDRIYKIFVDRNPFGIQTIGTEIPGNYTLYQNYPNPFNPRTIIQFDIPQREYVKLEIIDVLGRVVSTQVNGELAAGKYKAEVDMSNASSGIYFYKLTTGRFSDTKKLLLMK